MMNLGIDGFDWDSGNSKKIKTHGLSREDIEAFFQQESVYVTPDIKHSQKEERYLAVGQSSKGRPMGVVFTFRKNEGERLIRPISARYMRDKEAKRYEEESSKIEKR